MLPFQAKPILVEGNHSALEIFPSALQPERYGPLAQQKNISHSSVSLGSLKVKVKHVKRDNSFPFTSKSFNWLGCFSFHVQECIDRTILQQSSASCCKCVLCHSFATVVREPNHNWCGEVTRPLVNRGDMSYCKHLAPPPHNGERSAAIVFISRADR